MKRVGLIYTGFGTSLMQIMEQSIQQAAEEAVQFVTVADPGLIGETLQHDGVTPQVVRRLTEAYLSAVRAGADVIVSVCSTMGDVAALCKPLIEAMGVPFVRIDEEMMRCAVAQSACFAVVAANETIMRPNWNLAQQTLQAAGAAQAKRIVLQQAQGLSPEQMIDRIEQAVEPVRREIDLVVLTQASLQPVTGMLAERLGIPVLSAAPFAARQVARILWQDDKESSL